MPLKAVGNGYKLGDLAKQIGGVLAGNPGKLIKRITAIEDSDAESICFSRAFRKNELQSALEGRSVGAVILRDNVSFKAEELGIDAILVKDPTAAMVKLIPQFYDEYERTPGISDKSEIHPSAKLGKNVSVGPFCAIGARVTIEDDVVIHPHVVIYPDVHIGKGTVIHSGAAIREECSIGPGSLVQNGAVIGADGFGYIPSKSGLEPIPQVGNALLGSKVEVGANACIDRGTLGSTKIGNGTKIDNLVQVGHNVHIGESCAVCGQTGIAGSSKIGSRVVLGGQSAVADHVVVGSDIRLAGKSAFTTPTDAPGDYIGNPAVPAMRHRREMLALSKLPALLKRLKLGDQTDE